jgi:hypothetical protein
MTPPSEVLRPASEAGIFTSCVRTGTWEPKMPATTGPKQDGRFRKGQSGNPAGRPVGARHRATLLAERLMQQDTETIVKTVVEAAKSGDLAAARIVLDRVAPVRRDSPVRFEFQPIETADDASKAMSRLLGAVASGEVTPSEAVEVSRVVDSFVKAFETSELELRVRALENPGKS